MNVGLNSNTSCGYIFSYQVFFLPFWSYISASIPFNKFSIILEYGGPNTSSRLSSLVSSLDVLPPVHFLHVKMDDQDIPAVFFEGYGVSAHPQSTSVILFLYVCFNCTPILVIHLFIQWEKCFLLIFFWLTLDDEYDIYFFLLLLRCRKCLSWESWNVQLTYSNSSKYLIFDQTTTGLTCVLGIIVTSSVAWSLCDVAVDLSLACCITISYC